jgi:hypothetical protein
MNAEYNVSYPSRDRAWSNFRPGDEAYQTIRVEDSLDDDWSSSP